MMDRERQEKDLQEVFEATQGAYWAAIENAFRLQEQTIEFARRLIEAPAEALQTQAENNRATLEVLSEQSRKQRKAMENLVGESAKVYESLLETPFSHHQSYPEFEEATQAPEMSSEGR
jgi:DNA integrity scanning protein DisA with diadenylate cyclase activity